MDISSGSDTPSKRSKPRMTTSCASKLPPLSRPRRERPRTPKCSVKPWSANSSIASDRVFTAATTLSLRVLGRKTRLHPRLDAAAKRLDVAETTTEISRCLPGSRCLRGSGAIEDDLLALRQACRHRVQPRERDRALQPPLAALRVVFVTADEQRVAAHRFVAGRHDVDPFHVGCHACLLDVCRSIRSLRAQPLLPQHAPDGKIVSNAGTGKTRGGRRNRHHGGDE